MGASRLQAAASASQPRELTTQEKARRDWINEQRGIKDSAATSQPRMAGGISGIIGLMSRGAIKHPRFNDGPSRDKATRDWIDQQRGVEVQPDDKSPFRSLLGMKTSADRQRYQDRNSWIDEQIRKSKEEEEEKAKQFTPLTQEERRNTISEENFKLKDIWDNN